MASLALGVRFSPTTGGTGDFVYSGAVTGYRAATVLTSAKTYRYRAESSDLSQWENGSGAWNSGTNTLARTTVHSSSTGSKVSFSAAPQVAIIIFPDDVLQFDDAMSLTAAQLSQARANIGLEKKNYIVNGAMMVSQENGATAGTLSSYYPVDQFFSSFSNGGTTSIAQVASLTPAGSPNRIRYTATAADAAVAAGDFAAIFTKIEGLRAADLKLGTASARTVTLQFGVKAPAGTYCVAFKNGAFDRTYVAEYVIAGGDANTDVVKSVTVTLDTTGTWATNNTAGLIVLFCLMGGSTFQTAAGSWTAGNFYASSNQFNFMGTINNVFELFDVGLYEGTVAPAFKVPDYVDELRVCKRYYQFLSNTTGPIIATGQALSTTAALASVLLPVVMRASPTLGATPAATWLTAVGGDAGGTTTLSGSQPESIRLNVSGATGLVAGNAVCVTAVGVSVPLYARL